MLLSFLRATAVLAAAELHHGIAVSTWYKLVFACFYSAVLLVGLNQYVT